jgi:cobyrinic acid a,c-diamide synthase
MALLSAPRIMISGVSSSVGKSLLTIGLVVALRKKGMSVSCCVTGRALHQALVYTRITRRYCRIIDRQMLREEEIFTSLYQAGLGADVVIIDGHGGLYDGIAPGDFRGSDAEIAAMTQTPVLLVLPVRECSNSVSAVVRGFSQFTQESLVKAVVPNHIFVPEHHDPFSPSPVVSFLQRCMQEYGLPPVIGGLPSASFPAPTPPSSFSQETNCTLLPMQFFLDAGSFIANHIDIDALLDVAQAAPMCEGGGVVDETRNRVARIAVTDDSCFNVCYQDNIDLLRYYGAEIVPVSPLADLDLPGKLGGLYVTGAYLGVYGEELARNESMRRSIRDFAEAGGVIYSEGAGTAFLCRSFQVDPGGPVYPGVGLIPLDAVQLHHPSSMLDATTIEESVLGRVGRKLQGFSLGDWGISADAIGATPGLITILKIECDDGSARGDGYSPTAESVCTFNFLHFGSYPRVARSLVDAAAVFDKSKVQT